MVLRETVLLRAGRLEIELDDRLGYRLAYGDRVVYENGRRILRGKSAPYEFRSVEQLRYDFERDVERFG